MDTFLFSFRRSTSLYFPRANHNNCQLRLFCSVYTILFLLLLLVLNDDFFEEIFSIDILQFIILL